LSVSRYHAVLTYSDGIFLLDDLNSKSGTYVNGKRIKSAVVKVNDEIKLGSMTFYLKKIKDVENDKRKDKA
jgi:pSer/pThr/pTyr-binding forkhead associated (FHA) protein